MHVEQVMFRSGQVRCAGDLYVPDGIDDQAPAPAVVMGHSVTMVKEALAPHAEYLVRAGFVVLAIDYRTIGSSEGEPRCQWLPEQQVQDMRAGLSYLRTRSEVDPERIGLWGHSTGAGVAIVAGAIDRRVGCVAGQNPSMLDAWAALEPSRGRAQMGAVRTMLEQDAQRRFETGEGAVIPALASNDPKLAGYVAQAEELFPTFRNQMTLESLDHVLLWAPVQFIHRLAPTPLLLVTGVDDQVHAIDEVLKAYDRAWEPKRLELLAVDEFGLSVEPGLGQSMNWRPSSSTSTCVGRPGSCRRRRPRRHGHGACAPSTSRPAAPGRHHEPGHAGPATPTGPGRGRAGCSGWSPRT